MHVYKSVRDKEGIFFPTAIGKKIYTQVLVTIFFSIDQYECSIYKYVKNLPFRKRQTDAFIYHLDCPLRENLLNVK